MAVMTGLSGNEIYCLHLKGMRPGEIVVGNSVFSMGFVGGLGAGVNTFMGGEVTQVTAIVHEGRTEAYKRMAAEAASAVGRGSPASPTNCACSMATSSSSLLAPASIVRTRRKANRSASLRAPTGRNCIANSTSVSSPGNLSSATSLIPLARPAASSAALKSMSRGEVKEFSDVFNRTRHVCLERIVEGARQAGANAVVGIETKIMPFEGVHEMMMLGTASYHPLLPEVRKQHPVTSDLTNQEMWNMAALGYLPLKLLLGTAVYSLGVVGGLKAAFKSMSRGEINELTTLVYDAREHAIGLIRQEAQALGADDVVGIKITISEFGNLIEFMAIGTAVVKIPGVKPITDSLPAQAIIRDQDTWIS